MREVLNLSSMSISEILQKIKMFERKYGKTLSEFLKDFDENEANVEELVDVFIWEELEKELKRRLLSPKLILSPKDAELIRLLSPLRLEILSILTKHKNLTPSDIAKKLNRPLGSIVSALSLLEKIGLIKSRNIDGRKYYYTHLEEIVIKLK